MSSSTSRSHEPEPRGPHRRASPCASDAREPAPGTVVAQQMRETGCETGCDNGPQPGHIGARPGLVRRPGGHAIGKLNAPISPKASPSIVTAASNIAAPCSAVAPDGSPITP